MTAYKQGFLTKCLEHKLSSVDSFALLTKSAASRLRSVDKLSAVFQKLMKETSGTKKLDGLLELLAERLPRQYARSAKAYLKTGPYHNLMDAVGSEQVKHLTSLTRLNNMGIDAQAEISGMLGRRGRKLLKFPKAPEPYLVRRLSGVEPNYGFGKLLDFYKATHP